jgi:hypothetical protein
VTGHATAPPRAGRTAAPADPATRERQARREQATRDRRRRELDVGLGVVIGAAALVFAPGLGYLALIVVPVLVICGGSILIGRVRARRRGQSAAPVAEPRHNSATSENRTQ